MEALIKEKEKYLTKMKEVTEELKKLNEQEKKINKRLAVIKNDVVKDLLEQRLFNILWKYNCYVLIWEGLRCRVDEIEEMIKKQQNGEVE